MSKGIRKLKNLSISDENQRPLSNKFFYVLEAGLASAGPPLGPFLGKYGVNIANFCKDFNKKTSHYVKGIPLQCFVTVNPDRSCDIKVLKPPLSYYLQQAAGIENFTRYKGISGKVTLKHIYEIAKIRHSDPNSFVQVNDLIEVCRGYIGLAYLKGIQVVKDLDPEEYGQYLKERKEYLDKLEAELAAEKESKLLRS